MVKSASQLNQAERERYNWRDDELRKMRRIATALLALMAVLFVAGLHLERNVHTHWGRLSRSPFRFITWNPSTGIRPKTLAKFLSFVMKISALLAAIACKTSRKSPEAGDRPSK